MKFSEVPSEAFSVKPECPPMKLVVDYDALFDLLCQKHWLVLRTDPSKDKSDGNPMVKGFNNHVRLTKGQRLFTKRIAPDAWYVTL